ncbi:hypothetical protein HYU14_01475 [Candidatus Woesearchaeota archaeon]|nr:hypothetical protein [Candidatus Woesearchaeota archaeon]
MLVHLEERVSHYFAGRWKLEKAGLPGGIDAATNFNHGLFEMYCHGLKGIELFEQSSGIETLESEISDKKRKLENMQEHHKTLKEDSDILMARLNEMTPGKLRTGIEKDIERLREKDRGHTEKETLMRAQLENRYHRVGELYPVRETALSHLSYAHKLSNQFSGFTMPQEIPGGSFGNSHHPSLLLEPYAERYFALVNEQLSQQESSMPVPQGKPDRNRRRALFYVVEGIAAAVPLSLFLKNWFFSRHSQPLEFLLPDEYESGNRLYTISMANRFRLMAVGEDEFIRLSNAVKTRSLSKLGNMPEYKKMFGDQLDAIFERERALFQEFRNAGYHTLILKDKFSPAFLPLGGYRGETEITIHSSAADYHLRLYAEENKVFIRDIGMESKGKSPFLISAEGDRVTATITPFGEEWLTGYLSFNFRLMTSEQNDALRGINIKTKNKPEENNKNRFARFDLMDNWKSYLHNGQLTMDIEGMAELDGGVISPLPIMKGERIFRENRK